MSVTIYIFYDSSPDPLPPLTSSWHRCLGPINPCFSSMLWLATEWRNIGISRNIILKHERERDIYIYIYYNTHIYIYVTLLLLYYYYILYLLLLLFFYFFIIIIIYHDPLDIWQQTQATMLFKGTLQVQHLFIAGVTSVPFASRTSQATPCVREGVLPCRL